MLQKISPEFKKRALMIFIEELIRNSLREPVQVQIPRQRMFLKERPMVGVRPMMRPLMRIKSQKRLGIRRAPQGNPRAVLTIPRPNLPERLQYIKPAPQQIYIDLGALDLIVRDPKVRVIQCNGPDEKIIVKGIMGVKPTSVSLRADEIEDVLQKFSQTAKIPIHEGIYRVAAGNLVISAIVSTVIPTKFIIEKMPYNPKILRPNVK